MSGNGSEAEWEKQQHQQQQLLTILEQSLTLKTAEGREDVIGRLHPDIRANIKARPASRGHLVNIIETCQGYADGVHQLFYALEFFERESKVVVAFREFLGITTIAPSSISQPLHPTDPFPNAELYEQLKNPTGTMFYEDPFYIRREVDSSIERELRQERVLINILGAKQTGKSSALVRAIQYAKQQKKSCVSLNLMAGQQPFQSYQEFARYLIKMMLRQLGLSATIQLDTVWDKDFPPSDNLTYFLEDHIFPRMTEPLLLTMDNVDGLLNTSFASDFFALVRSWHDLAAHEPLWQKLQIILIISTEPQFLIDNIHQSPFNVGLKCYLNDFQLSQLQQLDQLHGKRLGNDDYAECQKLFNGHPYLVRKVLYEMVIHRKSWAEIAAHSESLFEDHLIDLFRMLQNQSAMRLALKMVLRTGKSNDDIALFKLKKAGLIIPLENDSYRFRCDLYRGYLEKRL